MEYKIKKYLKIKKKLLGSFWDCFCLYTNKLIQIQQKEIVAPKIDFNWMKIKHMGNIFGLFPKWSQIKDKW